MNSLFVALILKKLVSITVQDYRPISLINCMLKILLKMLASRLKNVLHTIVSEYQFGFINGRCITNCILIAGEIAHIIQQNLVNVIILKIDIEKAFDLVRWDTIQKVLSMQDFGIKWKMWIRSITSTARLSVLVNGSPTEEFNMGRGLRQGDPISPLIFILVSEILHELMEKDCEMGMIQGVYVGEKLYVSHLQFADDTIFFLENSDKSVRGIKIILVLFQIITGLKVNFNKSFIYTSDRNAREALPWAKILECLVGSFPFEYLGAPIGSNSSKKKHWVPLTKKVRTKLAMWKSTVLSKAGRLVLIKAVLDSLPTYWLGMFKIPVGVAKELEKVKRNFFWGSGVTGNVTTRKLHTIKWEIITRPKRKGAWGYMYWLGKMQRFWQGGGGEQK